MWAPNVWICGKSFFIYILILIRQILIATRINKDNLLKYNFRKTQYRSNDHLN